MRVLIVEDDHELSEAVAVQLVKEGYDVDTCDSGEDMLYYVMQQTHDLIILDRMLPKKDGLSLLELIRQKGIITPVIMVTALNGLNDRIDGLDAGADDYLVKPFAMEELLARIRAILRRPRKLENPEIITYGDLTLDLGQSIAKKGDKKTTLSKKEKALLEMFMRNHNQILNREQILYRVWGSECNVEDGNIDNYIYFLRRRLKSIDCSVTIKTVHGIGYRMESGV